MSLPIPLDVDLETARGNFRVTKDLRGLSFRSVVPGGFASAQISLDRPLDVQPEDIAQYGTLTVSDGRNGGVVWQGRVEDPSRGVGSDGRIWDVAAVGPSAHTRDRTVPLIYVDTSEERWRPSGESTPAAQIERTEDANGAPVWRVHAPEGTTVTAPWQGMIVYDAVREAGQLLGRVRVGWDAGFSSANFDVDLLTSVGQGAATVRATADVSTAGGTLIAAALAGTGHDVTEVLLERHTGGSTVGDGNAWAIFGAIVVRSELLDAGGSTVGGTYSNNTILASEVVADLLGRLLDQFDGATADIETTTTAIEQLAYPDGVTPAEVLDDLANFEPDRYWAAWERTSNDKARFEYVSWPTTVTYEATAEDGYTSTGSATDLYNQVTVRWRDIDGRIRTTTRTQTVPELDAAGLIRTAQIDLGDNLAGSVNAANAGDNFLAEHQTARNAGQLTVARSIIDHDRGRLMQPWELRPGKLIRLRGVQPRVDALNPGGRDGVSVLQVVAASYDAGSASATLELDSRPLTVTHAIGRIPELARASIDRRRR